MVLLKSKSMPAAPANFKDLHSNMVLLKCYLSTLKQKINKNLHSNMVLLKLLDRKRSSNIKRKFTFQYGAT